MTALEPGHVPDEWLLAAAVEAHNDGRDRLEDFDGDALEYLASAIAAVAPLVRAAALAERAPATVFLAVGGEYDGRWPRKVFAHRPDAEQYGRADNVEEWQVQPGPVETRTWIRAIWRIHDPAASDEVFDMVNPLDMDGYSEVRDYDGQADALSVEWWPAYQPGGPWEVQISGWNPDLVRAAWKERRDQLVNARGTLPLPLDPEEDGSDADPA